MKNFFKKEKEDKGPKLKDKTVIDKEINSKKVTKLITYDYMKVLRIVVWTFITILLIRGVVSMFKPDNTEVMLNENKLFVERMEKDLGLEAKLFSYAEEFTREYFTRYPLNPDDFKNRIMKFTSEQLAIDMNNSSYSEIINASAFSFEKYSDNQFNVSVAAKIKQFVAKPGQENVEANKKKYDTALVTEYIEVPIYVDTNNNMLVENIPGIIAAPEKAELKTTEYTGMQEGDQAVIQKINDGLVEFFKAYYSGEQTQLDFFLEKEGAIRSVDSPSEFVSINNRTIFKLNENEHLVTVELTIKSFGNDFKQRFNVRLVKNSDKYLVKSLDTRVSNLNIN